MAFNGPELCIFMLTYVKQRHSSVIFSLITSFFLSDPNARQSNPDQMLFMTLLFVAALFLYFFRPRPQTTEGPSKAVNSDQVSSSGIQLKELTNLFIF